MKLLERRSLLDQLHARLDRAVGGRGSVVCLLGEAGVGKTALAREFASQAGVRVLWSACENLATPEPLGPLRDWACNAGWQALETFDQSSGKLTLFSDVLSSLAARATLAAVEDLHWADDATLDLVRFLGRRIADRPVLLLITGRDDDLDARKRLRRALAEVPADAKTSLSVPRLSAAAVHKMAQEAGRDGEIIFDITGGNAFFVTEILKGGEMLPPTVRDAVLARYESLREPGRTVVETAAIFPRYVESWLLRRLCPEAAETGIDEAVTAGVIVADQDSYAFRHEIARRTIEDMMLAERRARLNEMALDLLRQTPGVALARLVHHADAAGNAAAIRMFAPRAAAEASVVGAHREAARHYVTALKHSITFEVDERVALYEKCAFELHLVGQMREAIKARLAAIELCRLRGDRVAEGDGLRWLSRLHYLNGDRVEAGRYAGEALAILEQEEATAELAMAYSNLSQLAMLQDDVSGALEWGQKAVGLATRFERSDILAHALNNMGAARRWTDISESRVELARGLEIALDNDLAEHAARAYTNAAYVEIGWRENTRAHTLLEAGLAYCETRDLETWRSYMNGCRAELLMREGKWEAAAAIALGVIGDEIKTSLVRFPAVVALARIRIRRGDPNAAILIDELERFLQRCMEAPRFVTYVAVVAERAWLCGASDASMCELLREAHGYAAATGNSWGLGEIRYWGKKLGVTELPAMAAAAPYQMMEQGLWADAARAWSDLQAPYEQALALLGGDEDAWRAGLSMLDAMGAREVADRFRKELREAGRRYIPRGPHAATRDNFAGLTRRQMDVLGLIDLGLSNAEIAARLFVSAKTIDHHVSAILAKLEARTRGEAAALARAAGVIGRKQDHSARE